MLWDSYGLSGGIGRYADRLKSNLETLGVTVLPLAVPRWANSKIARVSSLSLSASLDRLCPKKINIFHGLANINVPLVSRRPNLKLVLTVHDLIPLLFQRKVSVSSYLQTKLFLGAAVRSADAIVCISNWTALHLSEHYPFAASKISVIKNGLDFSLENALAAIASREGKSRSQIKILTVSRWELYKRLDLIPNILRSLPQNCAWSVVTDACGARHLASLAPQLIEQGNLNILVKTSDAELTRLYQAADVYVHPSLAEGFGLPLAEALGNGLPLVYVDGTGTNEADFVNQGIALNSADKGSKWAEAILEASTLEKIHSLKNLLKTSDFTKTGWHESALALKSLYNDLGF